MYKKLFTQDIHHIGSKSTKIWETIQISQQNDSLKSSYKLLIVD